MDKETWITSDEALKYGFATSTEKDTESNQSFEIKSLKKLILRNKELEGMIEEKTINKIVKEDAWTSFFNKKN